MKNKSSLPPIFPQQHSMLASSGIKLLLSGRKQNKTTMTRILR